MLQPFSKRFYYLLDQSEYLDLHQVLRQMETEKQTLRFHGIAY